MPSPMDPKPEIIQPKGEEFELLLQELSSEFHRLQQRIAELSRENSDLRADAAASAGAPGQRTLGKMGGGKGAANDARSLKATLACVEGDTGGHVQLVPLMPEDAHNAAESTSAWRQRSTQASGAQTPKISVASWQSTQPFRLREAFRYADTRGTGRLGPGDLMRVIKLANESVAYESLVDLIRVLNGLEPLGLYGAKDETLSADELGIDFDAFQTAMDEHSTFDYMTPELKDCLATLRRACNQLPADLADASLVVKSPSRDRLRGAASEKVRNMAAFWLETIPTIVILLNTLSAGLSADYPEHEGVWDIFENIFVAFYTCEFAVKLRLYGCRGYFRGPEWMWNFFDFVCLMLSLADLVVKIVVASLVPESTNSDNVVFTMIKIFRLTRLARLLRTLRFKIFTELKMMVLGVVSGLRVLTWAIALLVVLIYVVGVGMTNIVGSHEPEFNSVRASMFTLFRCWTEGCAAYDGTPLAERLRKEYGPGYMVFHILMTMFVTVGLFNLIMAIFIDNVVTNQLMRKHAEMVERSSEIEKRLKHLFVRFFTEAEEPEQRRMESSFVRYVTRRSQMAVDLLTVGYSSEYIPDVDKEWAKLKARGASITKDVFMLWLENGDFQQLLDDAEIDTANRPELFDVLDADMGGQLTMDELITGLMKLRGSVTKSDIVAIRLKVRYLTGIVENKVLDEGTG